MKHKLSEALPWRHRLRAALAAATVAAVVVAAAAWPAAPALAQSPDLLTGTLKKAHDTGMVTIGHRESSIPFSYLSARNEPIGYSVDLCKLIVESMADEVGREVLIQWKPVTAANRIDAVTSGHVDMECGSTTSNLERQKVVGFSPIIFVSGTKLMVKKGSAIKSYRDLGGHRVAVTTGTTNEKALKDLVTRFKLEMELVSVPDHANAFDQLAAGKVDAFATDDVLLYGLLAERKAQADYVVIGDFLSYDPYGLMYRKDDAQLAKLVDTTLRTLAEDREIERRYRRWFLQRLPGSGVSIDLPMSPQLETILLTLRSRTE